MLYLEIYKPNIKRLGSVNAAIKKGLFIVIDESHIKKAFNFGNGSFNDFKRYMENNKKICLFIKINDNDPLTRLLK